MKNARREGMKVNARPERFEKSFLEVVFFRRLLTRLRFHLEAFQALRLNTII
jgi:hypothetical protein